MSVPALDGADEEPGERSVWSEVRWRAVDSYHLHNVVWSAFDTVHFQHVSDLVLMFETVQ